jgi:hypothetical protein
MDYCIGGELLLLASTSRRFSMFSTRFSNSLTLAKAFRAFFFSRAFCSGLVVLFPLPFPLRGAIEEGGIEGRDVWEEGV